MKKAVLVILLLYVVFHCGILIVQSSSGEIGQSSSETTDLKKLEELMRQVDRQWEKTTEGTEWISFSELVTLLQKGNAQEVLPQLKNTVFTQFQAQFALQKEGMIRVFVLGVISAFFVNFSNGFLKEYLGETGFFAIYTMLFTVMLLTFSELYSMTVEAVREMQGVSAVLTPVFTMALALAGNLKTAFGSYTFILLSAQWTSFFVLKVVFPGCYCYFVLHMLNFSMKTDRFSKLAEGIRKGTIWIMRLLFGVITGLQFVQCLLLPVRDQVRNSNFSRGLSAIPGIGSGARALMGTIFDSAVVVKNAVGVAVLIFILTAALFPALKMLVFVFLYQMLSAILQPVAEKRVSGMISVLAGSGKILFQGYVTCVALFLVNIAIITAATSVIH